MSDFVTMGELLIDFTPSGQKDGRNLFMQNAGGAVANVVAAIAGYGISSAFMGMVGNDQFGKYLSGVFKNRGIDVSNLVMSDEYNTTLAFVHLFEGGERDFSFYRKPGADIMYTKDHIDRDKIINAKVFHFGSLGMTDEPMRTAMIESLELAKASNTIISYDPNYRAPLWENEETAKKYMLKGLEYADIIKISDNEIEFLFGDMTYEEAAKMLVEKGVKLVYVTLGKDGAIYANRDGVGKVGGFKANAIDATGAGDCFTGSAIYQFLKSNKKITEFSLEDMNKAALFANAAASICVEGRGGIYSMPTIEQVEERLRTSI